MFVKEKKSTWVKSWVKSCKESSKRETEIYAISEGMAEDTKFEDGDKSRLRKALKQHRKDRHEGNAARELLEEMQQNVGEAHARASESEKSLWKELKEYMYPWDREFGRPNNLSTKIWKRIQSNNAKSDILESDFADLQERTHQLGGTKLQKKRSEFGLKRKRMRVP